MEIIYWRGNGWRLSSAEGRRAETLFGEMEKEGGDCFLEENMGRACHLMKEGGQRLTLV